MSHQWILESAPGCLPVHDRVVVDVTHIAIDTSSQTTTLPLRVRIIFCRSVEHVCCSFVMHIPAKSLFFLVPYSVLVDFFVVVCSSFLFLVPV